MGVQFVPKVSSVDMATEQTLASLKRQHCTSAAKQVHALVRNSMNGRQQQNAHTEAFCSRGATGPII